MSLKNILKYINDIKYKKILLKNMYMLLLFSLLPLLIIILMAYLYYSSMLKNELVLKYSQSVSLVKNTMKTTFDNSVYQLRNLLSDQSLQSLMLVKNFEELGQDSFKAIIKNISIHELTYDYTHSMYVYSSSVGLITGSGIIDAYSPTLNPCVENFNQLFIDKKSDYKSFYTFSWQSSVAGKKNRILSVTRPYVATENPAGAVFINIDLKKLLTPVLKDYFTTKGVFAMKLNDKIIYRHYENVELADDIIDTTLAAADMTKNFEIITKNNKSWLLIPGNIEGTDLTFYFMLSFSEIANKLMILKINLTLLIIVYLFLIIVISIYISNKMYNPIDSLISTIKSVPSFLDESKIIARDEFSYISNTFNNMVQRHNILEHRLEDRIVAFRKAQLIALQSQINPHFLCNTLDNINWMAVLRLGDTNEISKTITILSKLLRVSLETSQSVHPLEKEIEYAKQYIEIMQTRYANKFEVDWNLSGEIKNVEIPKITLQPIIENALHHGIRPIKCKGILVISTWNDSNKLFIEISDNGNGFDDSEIIEKNRELQSDYLHEDTKIGIFNVNYRLKLLFGDEYGITLGKSSLGGASVVLSVPINP